MSPRTFFLSSENIKIGHWTVSVVPKIKSSHNKVRVTIALIIFTISKPWHLYENILFNIFYIKAEANDANSTSHIHSLHSFGGRLAVQAKSHR